MYRAADNDYTGPGACYAADRDDAVKYTETWHGLGGETVYEVELSDDASIVDVNLDLLVEIFGEENFCCTEIEYVYIKLEDNRDAVAKYTGATHARYEDDWPEGCMTVQRIAPGKDTVISSEYVGRSDDEEYVHPVFYVGE